MSNTTTLEQAFWALTNQAESYTPAKVDIAAEFERAEVIASNEAYEFRLNGSKCIIKDLNTGEVREVSSFEACRLVNLD